MMETIILASFFEQLHVVVTIGIFLAIYFTLNRQSPILGFLFGFGAAYLVWNYNSWYIIGMITLAFYFGYNILKTITGNIKDFFKI